LYWDWSAKIHEANIGGKTYETNFEDQKKYNQRVRPSIKPDPEGIDDENQQPRQSSMMSVNHALQYAWDADPRPMTLSRMRKDMREEILPLEKSTSDLNASESTVNVVERTYKEMDDFEERIEPRYLRGRNGQPQTSSWNY